MTDSEERAKGDIEAPPETQREIQGEEGAQ